MYSYVFALEAQCNTSHALYPILHGITRLGSNPRPLLPLSTCRPRGDQSPPGAAPSFRRRVLLICHPRRSELPLPLPIHGRGVWPSLRHASSESAATTVEAHAAPYRCVLLWCRGRGCTVHRPWRNVRMPHASLPSLSPSLTTGGCG